MNKEVKNISLKEEFLLSELVDIIQDTCGATDSEWTMICDTRTYNRIGMLFSWSLTPVFKTTISGIHITFLRVDFMGYSTLCETKLLINGK